MNNNRGFTLLELFISFLILVGVICSFLTATANLSNSRAELRRQMSALSDITYAAEDILTSDTPISSYPEELDDGVKLDSTVDVYSRIRIYKRYDLSSGESKYEEIVIYRKEP